MPEEYLKGRTTDPATWPRTPENPDRLASSTRADDTRRRTTGDPKASAADRPVRSTSTASGTSSSAGSPTLAEASGRDAMCGSHGGTDGEVTAPGAGTRPAAHA